MYQVKLNSYLWFSAVCAASIVHRNHSFRLYQQKKPESKVKFRQASNHCKRVLEAAKLSYASKTKESITSQKTGSRDFSRIASSVINKSKSTIPPLINRPELLSSASVNCLLKTFVRTLILMTLILMISLPVFPSITNLKLHNISLIP